MILDNLYIFHNLSLQKRADHCIVALYVLSDV